MNNGAEWFAGFCLLLTETLKGDHDRESVVFGPFRTQNATKGPFG